MTDPLQSLFVLGSSHREAPLELREQIALEPAEVDALRAELLADEAIEEVLILSTCNRFEVYGVANSPDMEAPMRERLCRYNGVDQKTFDQHSFWRTNLDVIQHALEVSAGLDSQMVGETEILGQMKTAYSEARAAEGTGLLLNRLFEKSFQAAKSARTETGISRGQVSIGSVVVDLASRIFGHLERSSVLLLGSGEVAEKTAQALRSREVADITVTSRTFEKAHALAHELGGAAIEFDDFAGQLGRFDIVVCSTAAPGAILSKAQIRSVMRTRPERPLFLIDLAMPRDVEPEVERLDNVYLYNLDDLSRIANENLEQRIAEIERARDILKGHAWNLWLQLRRRSLQQQVGTVREAG